jgi:hypothetical protein
MNNRDQARKTRANTLNIFLLDPKNATEFAASKAFKQQAKLITDADVDVDDKAAKADGNVSGFSKTKLEKKQEMSEELSIHAGSAYVHFENIGRHDLSGDLLLNAYEYMALADSAAAAAAHKVYTILNTNIALLEPDFITALDCADCLTTITDFEQAKGNTEVAHKTAPTDKIAFTLALDTFDAETEKLLLLARKLKKTNLDFYNKLVAASKMPVINVRHTGIAGTVTKASVAQMDATLVIEKTTKKDTTDVAGKYSIKQIKAGTYTATCTLATGEAKSVVVTLVSGQVLAVDFMM